MTLWNPSAVERIGSRDGVFRNCPNVIRVCREWGLMYAIIKKLSKRPCESPRIAGKYPWADCGKCPPCQARALIEGQRQGATSKSSEAKELGCSRTKKRA